MTKTPLTERQRACLAPDVQAHAVAYRRLQEAQRQYEEAAARLTRWATALADALGVLSDERTHLDRTGRYLITETTDGEEERDTDAPAARELGTAGGDADPGAEGSDRPGA